MRNLCAVVLIGILVVFMSGCDDETGGGGSTDTGIAADTGDVADTVSDTGVEDTSDDAVEDVTDTMDDTGNEDANAVSDADDAADTQGDVSDADDADAPAQWINSTGWDASANACSPHPDPTEASLRYYRATFDIFDASAAAATSLSGKMWADNQVTRIFINGAEVTEYQPPAGGGSSFQTADAVDFGSWGSSYYQAGDNEIIIAVKNLAGNTVNPEGLLVRVPDAFQVGSVCTQQ